jgi:hypothetical protein
MRRLKSKQREHLIESIRVKIINEHRDHGEYKQMKKLDLWRR